MKIFTVLPAAVALLISYQADAANLWCSGKIKAVYVDVNESVFAYGEWHATWTQICSLSVEWGGVSTGLCKTWFAMLQGAYHAQSQTTVNYWNSPYATCAEIPSYGAAPAPSYVMNSVQ